MKTQDKINLIERICSHQEDYGKLTEKFSVLFGSGNIIQGLLGDYIENISDDYVRIVSEVTGINLSNIKWFVYDNDCGKNKLKCSLTKDSKSYIISSEKDFVEFEELS